MERDGTPETELEEAIVESGLIKIAFTIGMWKPRTFAQANMVGDVEWKPDTDPIHKHVYDHVNSMTRRVYENSDEARPRWSTDEPEKVSKGLNSGEDEPVLGSQKVSKGRRRHEEQ